MNENTTSHDLLTLSADIVSAYVSNNSLPAAEIPALLASVHTALKETAQGEARERKLELVPVVPVKTSVTPDYIICLEDGRRFKSLRRHLRLRYNMSPEEYRAKWGLPFDYPMVAPNYAKRRSEIASAVGLSQMGRGAGRGQQNIHKASAS